MNKLTNLDNNLTTRNNSDISSVQDQDPWTFYIDVSGSVCNFSDYWNHVEQVYTKYNKANQVGKIFIWDTAIKEVSKQKLESLIQSKFGGGGTEPVFIANSLIANKISSNIVIFTDGEVYDSSVSHVDSILGSHKLDNIECYIIGNSSANLSVTCPFTRNNSSRVHWKTKNESHLTTQIYEKPDPELINALESIDLETFNAKYTNLESLIISRNMGKSGDPEIKEKLIKLKKHLALELAEQAAKSNENYGANMRVELESGNFGSALLTAKAMTDKYFGSNIGMEIEKKIGYLITLCGDLRGQYSIGAIRSNRMASAENVKEETSTQVAIEVNDLISKPVECPIIMDSDVPQIMVVSIGEPVLANVEKHIVDDIVSCPLRILNYPEIVAKLKPAISQWTGTQINENLQRNPFTKQELIGTIPLGSCEQHVSCGNYTLSKLFTSGKLLGNLHMYWAVIWYLVSQDTWAYLTDIKDQVTEHMIYRLKSSNTFASLTGLPQYVLTKVPTDVAVWFCVNSCLLNPPTDRDTCRLHLFNMEPMLAMLRELKYPISQQTMRQITRTKVLMSMLSMSKKSNEQFRNRMTCLVQNAIRIDLDKVSDDVKKLEGSIKWIPLDGPANQEQVDEILCSLPKYFSELTVEELVGLSKQVDASKSASAIELLCEWKPEPVVPVINWTVYGLTQIEALDDVTICPYTFRPYYNITYNGKQSTWVEKVIETVGPVDKVFSGCKRFIDFMYKYNRFPDVNSFLLFCYNRYTDKFTTPTLPYCAKLFANEVMGYYQPIFRLIKDKQMEPEQVIEILNKSCAIPNRIKLEQSHIIEQIQ